MHPLHECNRYNRRGLNCPQGHQTDRDADEDSKKDAIPREIAIPDGLLDDFFIYLHKDKDLVRRMRELNNQPSFEPQGQEFPEPIPFPAPVPFPKRIPQRERPAALQSPAGFPIPQPGFGIKELDRIYALRGVEKLRATQQQLPQSAVRTIERQSARGLQRLGGLGKATGSSLRGSGRGFLQNAKRQLAGDLGLRAASFRKERKRRKKEFDFQGGWTSTFPAGYFG